MAGLGALITSLINLAANLLPEVKNTFFAPLSSSSAQAPDACAVEADLRRLERMLERIKATLYDAEERNIRDRFVKLWLKEIRELGHEAEYVLEEYMYEVYRAQVEARNALEMNPIKGDLSVNGVYSVQIHHGMVDRIRNIKSRFEEIANDREALCLREEDAPRRKKIRYTLTPTSPLVVEESVFGREKEKEQVIDSLFMDYYQGEVISVLPIVGKGGIGKTTIAQLVYNDERVQGFFDLVGWVCASNDFCIERITQHIIESFTRTGCNLKSPSVLLEELAKRVRGKRVFLVLDDVWNEEPSLWESLRMPLMQATKLTILVTTRNISVARIMLTTGIDPLHLAYLSDDKCWQLFTHYAFQGINIACQDKLAKIGKKIVKKCSGLPLAVKLIATLLSHEEGLQSWMEILQSDLWELDTGNEMLAPLQISYERLPTYLKPCLLLCSMFPKDHVYSKNLMSRLWIAHGYIEPNGTKPIEKVAADYTKMLYERSFFDDYNITCDDYGLPYDATFRLHDMVHDLAWINSEKTCCSVEQGKQPVISKEVRNLHLNKELKELPELLCAINIPFMQTLVVRYHTWTWEEDEEQISLHMLPKAEHLRALDLEYPKEVLPFSLGNLKHLRYLFLGAEFVAQISPQSIFSCYNLRILILDLYKCRMELEGIGNLINLEFLQLSWCPLELPKSLGYLKKLRVLEFHKEKTYGITHLRKKNLLLPECIGNLRELQRNVITDFSLHKLPESFCKLTNLKELILQSCILTELPKDFRNLTDLQFLFLEELQNFPPPCTKLIPSCMINVCNLMMLPDKHYGAVGWLKEFNDLKGALMISGIQNITSITDANDANLISKHNLETLSLLWGIERSCEVFPWDLKLHPDYSSKHHILGISIGYSRNCEFLSGQDLDILEIFQPHANLKHLEVCSYPGLKLPKWMGDPLSCASLVKLWIRRCYHISSLPLGMVLSLKHLYIADCGKLLNLKWESLPSQLKDLTIRWCNSLIEVSLLDSLAELEISACDMLKSLSTMDPKMPKTVSESFEELKSFPSLKKMTITECPNLVIGANQLVLAEDCEVNICYSDNLQDWCFEHNFKYDSDEALMRIPSREQQLCSESHPMMKFVPNQETLSLDSFLLQKYDQNTGSAFNSYPTKLAALFQPPSALMYNGHLEEAKMDAALQEKWLLINIQCIKEFNSHVLNRDTWANETLCEIIRSNFIFWQEYNTMTEGRHVCTFYDLVALPAILVINPITGQKMRAWTGMVQPDRLLEDLLPYFDKGPKDHHAV